MQLHFHIGVPLLLTGCSQRIRGIDYLICGVNFSYQCLMLFELSLLRFLLLFLTLYVKVMRVQVRRASDVNDHKCAIVCTVVHSKWIAIVKDRIWLIGCCTDSCTFSTLHTYFSFHAVGSWKVTTTLIPILALEFLLFTVRTFDIHYTLITDPSPTTLSLFTTNAKYSGPRDVITGFLKPSSKLLIEALSIWIK